MTVSAIPKGYHTITPQLSIEGAQRAIDFYVKAFGAEAVDVAKDPSGAKIWHAALRVGDSMLFVNDVFPEMGGSKSDASLWLYVPDVDAAYKRAVDAGATSKHAPSDMFWGDRMAHVADPFGQTWTLATRKKDLTPEEMKKAEAEFVAQMKGHKP
ncbi:MAG TPA: VOC family protein [Minicystis sp.]|nr:VOC family protein [Minicystis sp.]